MNMVGSECSPCRLPLPVLLLERAMLFRCVVHPKGLNPFQAAKAWHLRVRDGLAWKEVRAQVRTINGTHPGQDAVEDAVSQELACVQGRPLAEESAQRDPAALA